MYARVYIRLFSRSICPPKAITLDCSTSCNFFSFNFYWFFARSHSDAVEIVVAAAYDGAYGCSSCYSTHSIFSVITFRLISIEIKETVIINFQLFAADIPKSWQRNRVAVGKKLATLQYVHAVEEKCNESIKPETENKPQNFKATHKNK